MLRLIHRYSFGELLVAFTALAGGLLLGLPAHAVTNIRYERWELGSSGIRQDVVAPVESTTSVSVSFDAISTIADADPAHGFRFALAERSPGHNTILVRIEAQPCGSFPAPGSDVLASLSVSLYCDAQGRLHARDSVSWHVTWCDLPTQNHCRPPFVPAPPAEPPGVADAEAFELVLLDENGNEGANPTPEDALHALPPGASLPPFVVYNAPDFAPSGSIGLYRDPGGNQCSDVVQPLVPFHWYVVARLEGMTRCGLSVSELGVHGLPGGVSINVTPNPHASSSGGNLFTTAVLGFPCERGDGNTVVLYTLDGVSAVPLDDVVLRVEQGNPPSNSLWPYPWVDLCPLASGSRRRMVESTFIVNPAPGHACDTTVHVERSTWTNIKGLYREQAVTPLR